MNNREAWKAAVLGALASVLLSAACTPPTTTLIPGPPSATEPAAQSAAAVQEALPPQAIAEGDIPARADIVTSSLRRIELLLQPSAAVEQIRASLGDRELVIQSLRGELDAINPNQISARRLQDMRLSWLSLQSGLAAWRLVTERRFSTLQEARESLGVTRAQWARTQEEVAATEGFAPELAGRVDAVLTRVTDVESRVRQQRNAVAAVSDRIAANQEAIRDAIEQIDAIDVEVRTRLLSREAPPLWRARGLSDPPTIAGATGAARDWMQAVTHYLSLRPGTVLFVVALFPLLLIVTFRMRARGRATTVDDGTADRARTLVERPISLAVAAVLVLSAVALPTPVGSASDLRFVLAIVPILRLGSVVFDGKPRRAMRGLVALSILMTVGALGPDGSLSTRLFLLAVTAAGLAGSLGAARGEWSTPSTSRWPRLIPGIAACFGAILAVSLAANLLGWVNLSKALTEATIFSALNAIAWLVVVEAVAVLVPALVGGNLSRLLPSVRRRTEAVTQGTVRLVGAVAVLLWLRSTLNLFSLTRPVRAAFTAVAGAELHVGGLTISAGALIGAAVIILATWIASRFVGFITSEEVVPRLSLRRGSGQSVVTLVNYTVWGVGIAMAASASGISGTQLAVVLGALSVGIGFGLQTIVNNFVSGLILIFERPVKVGDAVETPDYFGRVQRIGIRASVIRSFDGAEIVVPNGELIAKAVTNWTGTDEIRRAEVVVGVAYGTDPEAVLAILRRVAEEHPLVLQEPPINAQMIRFGDSSLDFRLRGWTQMDAWLDVVSDLHVAINRELAANGITIPFPQRDLHIKSTSAGSPAIPPARTE